MDLIDRDKLDSFKFRSASERMDLPVDYMVGWNDAVDGIMCNAPTVEAIPIYWLENFRDGLDTLSESKLMRAIDLIIDAYRVEKKRKEE